MADFTMERKGYSKTEVDAYIKKIKDEFELQLREQKNRIFELKNALTALEKRAESFADKEAAISSALVAAVEKAKEIERVAKEKHDLEIEQLKAFHSKWQRYYDEIIKKYPIDDKTIALREVNKKMSKAIESGVRSPGAPDGGKKNPVDAEDIYQDESVRLGKSGSIGVNLDAISKVMDESGSLEARQEQAFRKISGKDGKEFRPMDKIRDYLDSDKAKPAEKKNNILNSSMAVLSAPESDSGFSYEEALNPTESIEEIMKGLGLIEDEE